MVAKQKLTKQYVNGETGEVREKTSYVDMFFSEEDGYIAWSKKKSIKSYLDVRIPDDFSWAEKGRINELKHYILRDNQFLVYRSGNKIKPVGIPQMCNILDLSLNRTRTFVKKMKQHKIIKEINFNGETFYSFNPVYGLKDKRITLTLYLFFQEELTDMLPAWVINKFLEQADGERPNFKIVE